MLRRAFFTTADILSLTAFVVSHTSAPYDRGIDEGLNMSSLTFVGRLLHSSDLSTHGLLASLQALLRVPAMIRLPGNYAGYLYLLTWSSGDAAWCPGVPAVLRRRDSPSLVEIPCLLLVKFLASAICWACKSINFANHWG
jgi:hypothetical protein